MSIEDGMYLNSRNSTQQHSIELIFMFCKVIILLIHTHAHTCIDTYRYEIIFSLIIIDTLEVM